MCIIDFSIVQEIDTDTEEDIRINYSLNLNYSTKSVIVNWLNLF